MNRQLSEKEIAIFNGLMSLLRSGANPYLIKVQEIADAANVGKGTIYDYFKTKEEAISKAILYSINHEIEKTYTRLQKKSEFRDKFDELLNVIEKCLHNNLSIFNMLMSVGGAREFYEFLQDEQHNLSALKSSTYRLLKHLLQAGYAQGNITLQESPYYQVMAVQGAIAGFSHYLSQKNSYPQTSIEEAKDVAYKLLMKALN